MCRRNVRSSENIPCEIVTPSHSYGCINHGIVLQRRIEPVMSNVSWRNNASAASLAFHSTTEKDMMAPGGP